MPFGKFQIMRGATLVYGLMSLLPLLSMVQIASAQVHASPATKFPHPDRLSSTPWWLQKIKTQAEARAGDRYQGCLFGDSISSGIGHTLGSQFANLGQGGLSSASLLTQLKVLKGAHIHCRQAVMAVGTNDAWYSIPDAAFITNMRTAIALIRTLGTERIMVLPAFYSTVAASKNPSIAGSLDRVDRINQLIKQVAATEQVPMVTTGLEPLFQNHSLRPDLTFDGVHLNNAGKTVYRQFLVQIFNAQQDDSIVANPKLGGESVPSPQ